MSNPTSRRDLTPCVMGKQKVIRSSTYSVFRSGSIMTGQPEKVGAFVRRKCTEVVADDWPEFVDGPGGGFAERRLEL